MGTATTNQLLTPAEFLALPESASDGSHYELSEEELVPCHPPDIVTV